jgi:hypothetical protein
VYKISEEYEKEIERRGKGEIVKRKVDKISFVCLLQMEFMLMKEEEKDMLVKNNLVPVLPFLLSDEEKEREEEDSNEKDIKNTTIFRFLSYSLIKDDSLRSLLLSDERKVLLNKTLLFSLRRDIPFARRECPNVLDRLFFYGKGEELRSVISSGGMKCVVSKMREKEKREEGVKENGKNGLICCLCYNPYGNRILYRRKEGWKGEEIRRKIMWMIEEEDLKETLTMYSPHRIFYCNEIYSFNYGLGMCLHVG